MSFERKSLRIEVPLDLAEGPRCTEPMHNYEEIVYVLDQICKITVRDQDWVNPTTDGRIAWDHKISCTSNSGEELEHWQNRLHELSTLQCNMVTKCAFFILSYVICCVVHTTFTTN